MDMVDSRLGRRLRAQGLTTIRDYLALVSAGTGGSGRPSSMR
ncbi:MAG: hypothetical protein M0Z85_09900 [Gammaproteobacteria bacterium]|nr:hypothetical protein [Gammaproteobacteria bacterium]